MKLNFILLFSLFSIAIISGIILYLWQSNLLYQEAAIAPNVTPIVSPGPTCTSINNLIEPVEAALIDDTNNVTTTPPDCEALCQKDPKSAACICCKTPNSVACAIAQAKENLAKPYYPTPDVAAALLTYDANDPRFTAASRAFWDSEAYRLTDPVKQLGRKLLDTNKGKMEASNPDKKPNNHAWYEATKRPTNDLGTFTSSTKLSFQGMHYGLRLDLTQVIAKRDLTFGASYGCRTENIIGEKHGSGSTGLTLKVKVTTYSLDNPGSGTKSADWAVQYNFPREEIGFSYVGKF